MNTQETDEQMVLRIATECGGEIPESVGHPEVDAAVKFAIRFHAEKMKKLAGKSFDEWFDATYPKDIHGSRPSYRESMVMTLMESAFAAGAASVKQSPVAGLPLRDARITELESNLAEELRLNAMGSEREARLMARVSELERENNAIRTTNVGYVQKLADDKKIFRLEQEIAELRGRLEWSEDSWDGIACRDETIRLQDAKIATTQQQAKSLREALIKTTQCIFSLVDDPERNAAWRKGTDALSIPIDTAAIDALERDAQRYEKIKKHKDIAVQVYIHDGEDYYWQLVSGNEADAAIDTVKESE